MKKLKLTDNKKSYEIIVEKVKFLYGDNYSLKYEISKILKQVISRNSLSENQIENDINFSIEINDKIYKTKSTLFEVTANYDLTTDLKMQTKSLILKYYETYLKCNNISDYVLMINSMLKTLAMELNQDDLMLNAMFVDMNEKQLLKLLIPYLIKDEYQSNMFDLTYEEIILFQIKTIRYITENNFDQFFFIIIDIPVLTNEIIKEIYYTSNNTIIFVYTNQSLEMKNYQDFCICISSILDLASEETIYEEIINRFPYYVDFEEVIAIMKKIIHKEYDERTNLVLKMLK